MLVMTILSLFLIGIGFYIFICGFRIAAPNNRTWETLVCGLLIATLGKLVALCGFLAIANMWQHINF